MPFDKMLQIREVNLTTHGELKARAARAGMNLSDYLKVQLDKIVEKPSMEQWLERTRDLRPVETAVSAAEVIREMRDAR